MTEIPLSRVGTPLDRLSVTVSGWDQIPSMPQSAHRPWGSTEQVILERAKGAVMFRHGVNSHIAFAMLAHWSRTADVPIATLARALVDGTLDSDTLLDPD